MQYDKEVAKVYLELEKSKINRERATLVLNKGFYIYLMIVFVAVIGLINGFIEKAFLNSVVILGLVILLVGAIPFMNTMLKEESRIQKLIDDLKK